MSDGGVNSFIAGQVWCHVRMNGESLSIVSLWSCVNVDRDHGAAEWLVANNPMMMPCSDIVDSAVWTKLDNGNVRTLLPCHLR